MLLAVLSDGGGGVALVIMLCFRVSGLEPDYFFVSLVLLVSVIRICSNFKIVLWFLDMLVALASLSLLCIPVYLLWGLFLAF